MVSEAKEKIISYIVNCIEKNSTENKTDALTLQIEELSNSFDADILKQALLDLNDLNDTSYIILKDKLSSLSYFCNEIIIVYTLKLRLIFSVNISEIPDDLKRIFYRSFEMQNSSDSNVFLTGCILSNLCYGILDILISMDLFSLDNFIKIEEVSDLYTALLYEYLCKRKCLKKCPKYIKDICKLSYINDVLVSVEGWIIYFNKKSLSSIKKDIDLFCNYQLYDFANILDKISKSIEENPFTNNKKEYIKRLINKNKKSILKAINETSIQKIVIEYFKKSRKTNELLQN